MKKIYYLSSCSTCKRIIDELKPSKQVILQDIKTEGITPTQLDAMKAIAGSYEALFSRKALKYRAMGLHEKQLAEKDYRDLILKEYTFLKRPVVLVDGKIFIGNAKSSVAAAKLVIS